VGGNELRILYRAIILLSHLMLDAIA